MKKTLVTTALLLLAFIAVALVRANHEFLFYAATLVVLLAMLVALDRRFDFSQPALWAFNAWMLLHLLGGMASIGGVRLYDYLLVPWIGAPYHLLRYDQLVHVLCYVAIAMLAHEAIRQVVVPVRTRTIAVLAILAAAGIGALNEVVEFAAVVILGSTGVGDYTNTALDLVANLLGAMVGTALGALGAGRRRGGPSRAPGGG